MALKATHQRPNPQAMSATSVHSWQRSVGPFFFSQTHLTGLQDESIQTAIQRVRDNVALIGHLRSRSLNSIQENEAELSKIDELTTETRSLVQDLKNRIKRLESAPAQPGDVQLRKNRVGPACLSGAVSNWSVVDYPPQKQVHGCPERLPARRTG